MIYFPISFVKVLNSLSDFVWRKSNENIVRVSLEKNWVLNNKKNHRHSNDMFIILSMGILVIA